MFRRLDMHLLNNPICFNAVENLDISDFQYYDKDGFELNIAEQKFYSAMNFPINYPILNHTCWQEPWFELENNNLGLILDHCIFLCRASYSGKARDQLDELSKSIPYAGLLTRTKTKWGFDFALDAVRDGEVFEVLHIEYDHNNFDLFRNHMISFEWTVRHTDWQDAADRVWQARDQWKPLKGFDQNHWKSKFLIGWNKSEILEKSI
jgi:hypothetical protein